MNTAIVLPLTGLLALAAALSFVWGAPIFGVPLLVLALIGGGIWMFAARAKRATDIHSELDDAKAQKTDFTARDQETLTHQ
jgi:Na+/H+ antiporter NhaD/arsenite permease-like protein